MRWTTKRLVALGFGIIVTIGFLPSLLFRPSEQGSPGQAAKILRTVGHDSKDDSIPSLCARLCLASNGTACISGKESKDELAVMEASVKEALEALDSLRDRVLADAGRSRACAPCGLAGSGSEPPHRAAPAPVPEHTPHLLIGIPTVGRKAGVDYLGPTLAALAAQIPADPFDPLRGHVRVLVMNNMQPPAEHTAFADAQRRFADNPNFVFTNNDQRLQAADASNRAAGGPNVPGWRVQKQTRDVAALAQFALNKSRYFLFMEDDFEACPYTLRILHYLTNKAYTVAPDWLAVKVSFGMNGFLLKNGPDLSSFSDYLLQRQQLRPPDHLSTEWAAGETPQSAAYKGGRPHMTFRYNLLHHLGRKSSLREQDQTDYAGCFHPLDTGVLFEVDAFKFSECEHDDISPCNKPDSDVSRLNPPFGIDLKLQHKLKSSGGRRQV